MNRQEAIEHFTANPNLYRASAYVTAGILTHADYERIRRVANAAAVEPAAVEPAAVKPATVKPAAVKPAAVKPARVKWDIVIEGRRGLQRQKKGRRVIEWIEPEPPGWSERIHAAFMAAQKHFL